MSVGILEIQRFISIKILLSIALKSLNFPDNLDFKGKLVAKFLLRSLFLSICSNMMFNNVLTEESFKKYAFT